MSEIIGSFLTCRSLYDIWLDVIATFCFTLQVKRRYRIAPAPAFSDRRRNSSMLPLDGRQRVFPKVEKDDGHMFNKAQIDLELEKMRNMTPQEAAAAAAQAVAEAEAAIAEAEEAAREAEAAEADAEAAQAFAAAAVKTLKGRSNPKMVRFFYYYYLRFMILFSNIFLLKWRFFSSSGREFHMAISKFREYKIYGDKGKTFPIYCW